MMNRFTLVASLMLGPLALQQGCGDQLPPKTQIDASIPVPPDAGPSYARGLVYQLDGQDYYLDGPLEDGARDTPGHVWRVLPDGTLEGRQYNTGPFGIPKYYSSDAEDGQLLYEVHAIIDTWSMEKAETYMAMGYTHYHELVTVAGRTPHPSKVAWFKHTAVASFTLDGGTMPWMAHPVTPGVDHQYMHTAHIPYPYRETYLYVGCVNVGDQDPDFMLVVGANPDDPDTYGKIVHRVDMPELGDEIHHYGFNVFQTRMLIPGLFSNRIHILDVETDPARPALLSYKEDLATLSGYSVPHTVIGLPDGGYLLTMIGNSTDGGAPGGMVHLDAEGKFVEAFGPAAARDPAVTPPTYMYDVGLNVLRNRMITTTFGLPKDVGAGINPAGLGDEVYVWDYKTREVLQVVNLGANTGALEVRWLDDPGVPIGFTNTPGTSQVWRWDDMDLDGVYEFKVAITLPEGSIPTDMVISSDDKYLYVANWMGNNVMQFDITDPFNPKKVAEVPVTDAQMMRLSPDNKRLYVTNSLLSTWDDTEFPIGTTRNQNYGIFLIDVDHENGGMTVNPDFHIDLMNVQKQNTIGAARPHQVFFDRNVPRKFGSH
jgi:selenium-binding protein 1